VFAFLNATVDVALTWPAGLFGKLLLDCFGLCYGSCNRHLAWPAFSAMLSLWLLSLFHWIQHYFVVGFVVVVVVSLLDEHRSSVGICSGQANHIVVSLDLSEQYALRRNALHYHRVIFQQLQMEVGWLEFRLVLQGFSRIDVPSDCSAERHPPILLAHFEKCVLVCCSFTCDGACVAWLGCT